MENSFLKRWRTWPILYTAILMPFVVFAKRIELPESVTEYLHWEPVSVDVFTYYRGLAIILVALIMCGIAIYDIYVTKQMKTRMRDLIRKPSSIALLVLSASVLLSYMTSEFKDISLLGQYITGEGTLHWLAYVVIYFYSALYVDKLLVEQVGKGVFGASVCIFIVGIFAYYGYSLIEQKWYLDLVKPPGMKPISYEDSFASQFVTFFGNPNHVGSYVALLLPMFLVYPFKWNHRNIHYWVPIWILFIILVFSRSSAGLLGVAVAIAIWMFYLIFTKKFKVKRHGVLLGGMCGLYILVSLIAGGGSISDEIAGLNTINADMSVTAKLSGITATPDSVTFDYLSYEVSIKRIGDEIEFHVGGVAQDLQQINDDGRAGYTVLNEELSNIKFFLVDSSLMELHFDNHVFFIVNTKDALVLTTMRLEPIHLEEIPAVGFKGYEKFASSRGYIWSRSIPMLADTVLLGHGADTYAMHFPQYDVVGKIIAFDKYTHTVDKPHNIYLMIGINFGVLALVCFLLSIAFTMFDLIRKNGFEKGFVYTIMFSGIVTTWFFNDSMVLYVFIFWVLFGMFSNYDSEDMLLNE